MAEAAVDTSTEQPVAPDTDPKADNPAPYDWKQDIHPDVKAEKVWESIPDLKTLTKAYADAAKYNVGAVKIPAPEAPAEAWNAFYEKLGRPASPEAYRLSEEAAKDQLLSGMRNVAHSAGLTPSQWQLLSEGYSRQMAEQQKVRMAEYREADEALKADWGGAYPKKLGLLQKAIKQIGGDEVMAAIESHGLGNNVGFIKMMAKMAEALVDEKIVSGELVGQMSNESAKAELDVLVASKAYLRGDDPGHNAAVARAKQLFELLYN